MTVGHLIERAKERYDLELTVKDICNIISMIRDGKCIIQRLEKQNQSKVVLVKYQGVVLYAVANIENHYLRTFLPKTAATRKSYFAQKRADGKAKGKRKTKKMNQKRYFNK